MRESFVTSIQVPKSTSYLAKVRSTEALNLDFPFLPAKETNQTIGFSSFKDLVFVHQPAVCWTVSTRLVITLPFASSSRIVRARSL